MLIRNDSDLFSGDYYSVGVKCQLWYIFCACNLMTEVKIGLYEIEQLHHNDQIVKL